MQNPRQNFSSGFLSCYWSIFFRIFPLLGGRKNPRKYTFHLQLWEKFSGSQPALGTVA
jgi:hypothetical protein